MELEGKMEFLGKLGRLFTIIPSANKPFIFLDILIVALLIYWLYVLIKETRAWRILLGITVVLVILLLSRLLGLITLNWIIKNFLTMLVVAIPVVFQPELRAALEKIGRVRLLTPTLMKGDKEKIIDNIAEAASLLAKSGNGALIVIQRQTGLRDYAETGTILDALVSTPLLLNIFSKRTPLHDGAVIISGSKILAAGCMLPLDESRLKYNQGARHRAALGISKETDALVVLVSEEEKNISLVSGGKIESDLSAFDLKQKLLKAMEIKPSQK